MAGGSRVPASYRFSNALKPKNYMMDKTRAIPTPLRQKVFRPSEKRRSPEKIPFGKRNRAHGRDVAPETCSKEGCNRSLEAIGPLCARISSPPAACMTRGQQGISGWWRKTSSAKVLGHLKECMQAFAQHCLSVNATHTTTLQILSLSDGNVNDADCVPTSVMLAHAFASMDLGAWPAGLKRIRIFGSDDKNPEDLQSWNEQQVTSWMPAWLELHHVRMDNKLDLKSQLYKAGLCPNAAKFDVILMRQGLCYCEDRSFDVRPPEMLQITGIKGEDGSGKPSGLYALGRNFINDRPCYRNGEFLLHWRPGKCSCCGGGCCGGGDWAIVEDNERAYVWAKVNKDSGSPALAQASWWVWDEIANEYVSSMDVTCDVLGSCPWRRAPSACKSCAGISLDAATTQDFMRRVAAVMNKDNPNAFALLHGGYYKGVADEVQDFYLEVEKAAERFNLNNSCVCASVLRRPENQDAEDDPVRYWNQINGLLLSNSLE